ncbi:ABC transporter permease [Aggregatilinea lenta]|uniref:ABC transporter permease n=1 Tax=Aggregatilinea lenta TaxID=913108 RepID=UPI000E5B9A09|nr:ABC transporter permease [Aggregatilinea lenta]
MSEATLTQTKAPARQFSLIDFVGRFAPLIFLIALVIVFGVQQPRFLSSLNLFNVMRQISITGLISIGMTFVILTSGIDLSVGSLLALSGLICAAVAKGGTENTLSLSTAGEVGYGVTLAALTAMAVGTAGGMVQGLAITQLGVPPFVVTLGGLSIFRGMALLFSNGGPISGFTEDFRFWGQEKVMDQVPVPVIVFIVFAVLAHIVLRYTRYGRHVYAVGGNPEAARLSGLNVNFILVSVYTIVGFFSGMAGFVLAARLNSAEAVAGQGYELDVIASVVIGGTSLFGGEGGIPGTVIGAMLIGVLKNGLVLMNVSSYTQQIIIGVIIVVAVAFDRFIKSKRRA